MQADLNLNPTGYDRFWVVLQCISNYEWYQAAVIIKDLQLIITRFENNRP